MTQINEFYYILANILWHSLNSNPRMAYLEPTQYKSDADLTPTALAVVHTRRIMQNDTRAIT